jgi:hypothetical protein
MSRPVKTLSRPGYTKNQAVAHCLQAWQRTFDLALVAQDDDSLAPPNDDSTYFAHEQAAVAFRDAMPPLAGHTNISNFIACATYAMLKHILPADEANQLLAAAKIALAAIRVKPASFSKR